MGLASCSKVSTLAELPIDDQPLIALYPPDGATRLREDVPIQVVVGGDELPTVQVVRNGISFRNRCTFGDVPYLADCGVLPRITADDQVSMTVLSGGDIQEANWAPIGPFPGLGWSLLDGTDVTRLGGGSAAADAVSPYLKSAEAFLALAGYDGTPGRWKLLAGETGFQTDGQIAPTAAGFTFVLPVDVSLDGHVTGSAGSAWLEAQIGSQEPVQLLILDVKLEGKLDPPWFDLTMSGVLPAMSLDRLRDALGALGPLLGALLQLDVDRDGDGEPDSATLELSGSPEPAELSWWNDG